VESPVADSGSAGRVRKQSRTVALSAVVTAVDVAVAEVVAEVGEIASVVWLTNLACACAASKKREAAVFKEVYMMSRIQLFA